MGLDSKKVVLAVGLATFTGVALYLLYKKVSCDLQSAFPLGCMFVFSFIELIVETL